MTIYLVRNMNNQSSYEEQIFWLTKYQIKDIYLKWYFYWWSKFGIPHI